MVMFMNYQPFRSWLRKVDKGMIKSMANGQSKKSRKGNTFMVIGANGYIGWALICQLAYKFSGCHIIAIDKDAGYKNSMTKHSILHDKLEKLSEYFKFTYDYFVINMANELDCESALRQDNPDFVINLADGDKQYNPVLKNLLKYNKKAHLIISTGYKSKRRVEKDYPITDFKTANVVGTCNWITLIDPVLATNNDPKKWINRLISDCVFSKKVVIDDRYIPMISLEDITRAVVKIIRKGQTSKYERYFAHDKIISSDKLSMIISSTLEELGYPCEIVVRPTKNGIAKLKDKKRFVKLIDKHRPPVEYMISYSCKNFLDTR